MSIESVKTLLCCWALECQLHFRSLIFVNLHCQSKFWDGMRVGTRLQLSLLRYSYTPNSCASNFSCVLDTNNVRDLSRMLIMTLWCEGLFSSSQCSGDFCSIWHIWALLVCYMCSASPDASFLELCKVLDPVSVVCYHSLFNFIRKPLSCLCEIELEILYTISSFISGSHQAKCIFLVSFLYSFPRVK